MKNISHQKGTLLTEIYHLPKLLKNKDLDLIKRVCQKESMKIGYARVSTEEQNLSLQLDELEATGCEKIFQNDAGF